MWLCTGHASQTFALIHSIDPPFLLLTSCCGPPGCRFFFSEHSLSILSPTCPLHSARCCFLIQESSHPVPSCPPAAHGPVPFSSLLLLSLPYSMIFPHKWPSSHSGLHRSALAWCLLRVFLCCDYIHTPSSPLHPAVVSNEQLWNCLLHIFSADKW